MPEGASSISRGGVLAHRGGFGTFGWTGTGRWTDSEAGKTYDSAAATPHQDYPHGPGSAVLSRAEGTARSPGDGPDSTSGYRGLQSAQRDGPASQTAHPT